MITFDKTVNKKESSHVESDDTTNGFCNTGSAI